MKDDKGKIIGHFSYGEEVNEKEKLNDKRSFKEYDTMHEKYKKNLKEISRKLLLIREEEKKRLSIDLHDEIGCMAVNLGYNLYLAEKKFKENNVTSGFKYLEQIKIEFNKALRQLKNISIDMRPPQVGTFEIQDIINMYVSRISKQSDINIKLESELNNKKLNEELKLVLYRVLQESLNNVIKHSEAQIVKIKLSFQDNNIKFIIRDDGKGFDLKLLEKSNEIGMGLWGMKERVESYEGEFSIKSKSGSGTTISVVLPLEKN